MATAKRNIVNSQILRKRLAALRARAVELRVQAEMVRAKAEVAEAKAVLASYELRRLPTAELQPPIGTSVSGAAVLQYKQPVVYCWRREMEYLYVGCSTTGIARFLCRNHDSIDTHEKLLPTDCIDFWYFPDVSRRDLQAIEAAFIAYLKPKYNKHKQKD